MGQLGLKKKRKNLVGLKQENLIKRKKTKVPDLAMPRKVAKQQSTLAVLEWGSGLGGIVKRYFFSYIPYFHLNKKKRYFFSCIPYFHMNQYIPYFQRTYSNTQIQLQ